MFQLLDLPDMVLLPISPSHLSESRVSYVSSKADSFSIATMMNSLLQTTISVLRTQGNKAACLNAGECFRGSQRSMHRCQDNIATSDRLHKA